MSWTKNKNNRFEISSLIMQYQWTISLSDFDVQWKVNFSWQPVTTSSVVGLRRSSKALPKAKIAPKKKKKKGYEHYFGSLLPVWSTATLWIPKKSLYRRSILSKLIRFTENCNACSWHWSTKGPNSPWQCLTTCPTTNASKVEWIGLWSFGSSAIFTWPLINWLPVLEAPQQLFEGKMLPQSARGRKCFSRVHGIPKQGFSCYRKEQTFFSLVKLIDCNGSYFG